MSKLDTGPYKGVRDFYPEDQFILNYISGIWRKTAERFGYSEFSASILEPSELYKEKTGDEIVNEQTYTFLDRGGREVTLRPEMTPTAARMVAGERRNLAFPLRWFSIPNLFRYEAPQRGRLREHWQLNADIFGVSGKEAEIEIIELAYNLMKNFGATDEDFEIRVNDLSALKHHLSNQGVPEDKIDSVRRLLDKRHKITGFDEQMENLLGRKISLEIEPSERIAQVIVALKTLGAHNICFVPDLSRGFDYYTGIVFEVFDKHKDNPRSLFGGGRYDNLTELFGGEAIPAVGFGSGDVTMRNFLETHELLPAFNSTTQIAVLPMEKKYFEDAAHLARQLRELELNTSVDWSEKKIGDKISSASKQSIRYIIVVGSDEAESKTYKLKDLETGEEKAGPVELLKMELDKIEK